MHARNQQTDGRTSQQGAKQLSGQGLAAGRDRHHWQVSVCVCLCAVVCAVSSSVIQNACTLARPCHCMHGILQPAFSTPPPSYTHPHTHTHTCTSRCALDGLLAGGLSPSQLIAVSRNPDGAAAQAIKAQGVEVG